MSTQETIANFAADAATMRTSVRVGNVVPFVPQSHVGSAGGYDSKRAADMAIAGTALLLLAPIMILVWLLVYVTSGGPGLFWSQRIGRDGRSFWMPKYRTMSEGAPLSPREVLEGAEAHITPVGAWLRRSALDELPQLWCILKGDMSIIGPRPLLPNDPGVAARRQFPDAISARPGLSGLAQVVGRNSVSPRRKARLDAFYAREASLGLDLKIFWRTVGIVLTSRGFL